MLFASLYLVTAFISAFFARQSVGYLISLDWSGYVVTSDFVNPQPVVTAVSGSWIVPTVEVSTGDTFSAAWIGNGGQLDNTLIQTGTEQDSTNGQATYSAWYELLPFDSITITTMAVSPGDKITASIDLAASAANEWVIEINDVTNGQQFSKNLYYGSSRLSAEWIVERPTVNNSLSALANFGNITFTGMKATMDSTVGTINNFPFTVVTMNDRQNRQLVNVSSLASKGSSFMISYLSSIAAAQTQMSRLVENRIIAAPNRRLFLIEHTNYHCAAEV